jgi:hypothetical protein
MISRCSAESASLDGRGPVSRLSINRRTASLTDGSGSCVSWAPASSLKIDASSASHNSVLHEKEQSISKMDTVGRFLKHRVRNPSARNTQDARRRHISSATNSLHLESSQLQHVGDMVRLRLKMPIQRIRDTKLGWRMIRMRRLVSIFFLSELQHFDN